MSVFKMRTRNVFVLLFHRQKMFFVGCFSIIAAKIVKIMQSTFNKSKINFPLFSLNRKIVSFFWGGYSCQIGVFVVALLSYCVSK